MENIFPHLFNVSKQDRNSANKHNSFLIWFTGLSGSGKSTLANELEIELFKAGIKTYILDGDNVRNGLNEDLSFEPQERSENIRRVAELSKLLIDAGLLVIASFVSPYKNDREIVNNIVNCSNFVEIFVNTSVDECEKRDVKGLYEKARCGEIKNLTGVSSPYEIPDNPDLEICTETELIEESVKRILEFIAPKLKLKNE
jgi:adenylylsulfate kinase